MSEKSTKPEFSASQKRQLTAIGLFPQQIAQLETHALPISRVWTKKSPPMSEVRDSIEDVRRAISALKKQIERISKAAPSGGLYESKLRIEEALWEVDSESLSLEPFEAWQSQVEAMLIVCSKAMDGLQSGKRNTVMTGNYRPIHYIYEALEIGWREKYDQEGVAYPAWMMRASSSDESDFRKIVEICYAAIGINTSPERAIKAYLSRNRERRARRESERQAEADSV